MTRKIARKFRRGLGLAMAAALVLGILPAAHAVPIDPGSLSGITGWYKADGLSGYSDGDAVTLWSDSSASGYDAVQTEVLDQPMYVADAANGIAGVHFDRGQFLNAGDVEYQEYGLYGMTVIGVALPEGNGTIAAKMNFETDGRQWRLTTAGWDVQAEASSWDATNLAPIPSAAQDYNWMVVAGVWNSGQTDGVLNGDVVGQAENSAYIMPDTPTEVLIGASNRGVEQPVCGLHDRSHYVQSGTQRNGDCRRFRVPREQVRHHRGNAERSVREESELPAFRFLHALRLFGR